MTEDEDNIEPAIGGAQGSLARNLKWVPIPDAATSPIEKPLPYAFCIFNFDENGDPNKIDLDSVWLKDSDAIQRMQLLAKLESKLLRTHPEDYPGIVDVLLHNFSNKFPLADGLSIDYIKEDGMVDDTRGIFCHHVFFNRRELLDSSIVDKIDEYFEKFKK